MRAEEFFEIIDGIDDDIILDVPDANAERATRVVIEHKKTPILAIALLAACFVMILVLSVFVAAKLQSNRLITSEDPGNSDSSDSSDSEDEYVLDKEVLNGVRLINPIYEPPEHDSDIKLEELLCVYSTNLDLSIKGIYAIDTGIVIWAYNDPYDHYFWLDKNNVEVDHVAFNINDPKGLIPDREYPNGGYFIEPSEDGTSELRYYQNGRLKKTVKLPDVYRAAFTKDHSQYLYITPDKKSLVLYDLETETVVQTKTLPDLGYNDNWGYEFVNTVTSDLATVSLFAATANSGVAPEYTGNESLRGYLLELPTLRQIQGLFDSPELTAIDDENFILTTRYDNNTRLVFRAESINGEIVETTTKFTLNERSQFYNSSNIILSPNKKVLLIRDWDKGNNYMRCTAVSTDTMRVIWECELPSGETLPSGLHLYAAITDDAVLYMFGDTLNNEDAQPLYIIQNKNGPYEPPAVGTEVKGGMIMPTSDDNETFPNPIVDMGNGTQAELDRFRELLGSTELYSLNGYIYAYDHRTKMSDMKARDIVYFLFSAPLSFIPPDIREPFSTDSSHYVKGYDKDGNFLFEVIDAGIFIIRFQDGTSYDFRFDGPKYQLGDYLKQNY